MPTVELEEQVDAELVTLTGTGDDRQKFSVQRDGYILVQNLSGEDIEIAYNDPKHKPSDYKIPVPAFEVLPFPKLKESTEFFIEGTADELVIVHWSRNKFPEEFINFLRSGITVGYVADTDIKAAVFVLDFIALLGRAVTWGAFFANVSIDVKIQFRNEADFGNEFTLPAGQPFTLPEGVRKWEVAGITFTEPGEGNFNLTYVFT